MALDFRFSPAATAAVVAPPNGGGDIERSEEGGRE